MADEVGPYTCESIQVLSQVEHIRRRPGMYVGDATDGSGQHRLLEHLAERVMNDHLCGYPSSAELKLEGPRVWFSARGRGMAPLARHNGFEMYFSRMSAMHDYSLPMLNALTSHLQVDVNEGGSHYRQHFERGKALGPVARIGDAEEDGLQLRFELDEAIFDLQEWDIDALTTRFEELCCIVPGLRLSVQGQHFEHGEGVISLLAARLNDPAVVPAIVCAGVYDDIDVEVALTWVYGEPDAIFPRIHGYVNHLRITKGSQFSGLLRGVGQALGNVDRSLNDADPLALAEPLTPGLVAVVRVELEDPQFEDYPRQTLSGDEPGDAVAYIVERQLTRAWRAHPEQFDDVRVACLGAHVDAR